jgi:tetratricopeptide (TPR) repeat protein
VRTRPAHEDPRGCVWQAKVAKDIYPNHSEPTSALPWNVGAGLAGRVVDAMSEADDGAVVNVEHLMAYVDEQREDGNAAFKAKKYSEALECWQRGLDAMGQAEGKPMRRSDVESVVSARSILHSNRGQALITMQFWRRAVGELTEAMAIDPSNAKALWRRYKAHKALKAWAEAEADLVALQAPDMQKTAGPLLADAGLGKEQLAEARAELQAKQREAEKLAEETFDDRVEDAQNKGITELRTQFEEVTKRNGLHGNAELATELADMLTRPGGVTVGHVAATYQIDEDDAEVLMRWTKLACTMRDQVGYQGMPGMSV